MADGPLVISFLLDNIVSSLFLSLFQNHNSRYAGGCLVGFQGSDPDHALLISPSGTDFDNISILGFYNANLINKCLFAAPQPRILGWICSLEIF